MANAGSNAHFASTHWSVVLSARGDDADQARQALEALCVIYWHPLYSYIRRRGYSPHDAQDLTQGFIASLLARDFLDGVSSSKGKFRSFLLASLNNFLAHERERSSALKRGGGEIPFSLDAAAAEIFYERESQSNLSPEKFYDRSWAVGLLERALAALKTEYASAEKSGLFAKLRHFLEEEASAGDYARLAGELGMSANTVAVTVHRLRHRYRELVREEVAQTVSAPGEIEDEMRNLFAALSSA